MVHGGYMCCYSYEGFDGAGAFFCEPTTGSLNAPYAKHERSHDEDSLSQNGSLLHTQNIGIPPSGIGS